MLNNQSETNDELNAQLNRRVRPDEFSAAVVAIQKRKAEQQRILSETVIVDDVVRDLNIDATPDEILAEVEAQRKAKASARIPRPPAFSPQSGVVANVVTPGVKKLSLPRAKWLSFIPVVIVFVVLGSVLSAIGLPFNRLIKGTDNVPLSTLRDNVPGTITNSELNELIHGGSPSKITITENEDPFASPWTIIHENGQYYIWANANDPLPTSSVTLYNDSGDVPTDDATKLTVPVSSLAGATVEGDGLDGTITVQSLKLDNHKDDEWVSN